MNLGIYEINMIFFVLQSVEAVDLWFIVRHLWFLLMNTSISMETLF